MFTLVLHTALLVLAAFILGAVVGCLLRRFLASGGAYGPAHLAEAPGQVAKTAERDAPRKKRPTPAESAAAAATAMVEAQTAAREDEMARKDAAARAKHEAQVAKALEENRRKAAAQAAAEKSREAHPSAPSGTMDENDVAAALADLPADASNEDKANAVGTRPEGLDAPLAGSKDDLQRIKGIGKVNEGKLNDLGIYHFSQIASWTPPEARWVGTFLAFMGRIEREDWIGQAKTLAAAGATDAGKPKKTR